MLAVDVVANAIRASERTLAAGTLAERYLRALHAAGYLVVKRDEKPSDKGETNAANRN